MSVRLPDTCHGERLDQALAAVVVDLSRAALQRLIRGGHVTVAGKPVRSSDRVRGGETVDLELPSPEPIDAEPEAIPLSILFEDDDLVIVDKAAGMAVHPGAGVRHGTLVNALLHHCRGLSGIGGAERPGIVHRLDRDTTGVMVIARNDVAHRALSSQFKARTVRKLYEALAWGLPRSGSGVVDQPIGRHPSARVKMAVRSDGRPSRTAYRVVSRFGPVSLFELTPSTGRTHQIRVHLSSIKHPIVGDPLYGGKRVDTLRDSGMREILRRFKGVALHARSLGFTHPATGEWCEFRAPRPAAFQEILDSLASYESPHGSRGG